MSEQMSFSFAQPDASTTIDERETMLCWPCTPRMRKGGRCWGVPDDAAQKGGSMTDLPEPMTPPDCDLRDYLWMPLDVRRLLNSETWILGSAEVKVACMTLWCEAWQQVPAASLPDNDRMIAHLSGAGPAWKKIAADVLKGWVRCADGRLYHPTVAEKARESWASVQRCRARVIRRLEMESGVWSTLRRTVFVRDDFTCQYCGVRGVRLECDHVHPLSRGGATELENLATSCRPCNRSKGSKLVSEWVQ